MATRVPADLPRLPSRAPSGHKGTFGTVVIVGGHADPHSIMAGAPALAALGALRAGAGLARVLTPRELVPTILAICPSITCTPLPVDSAGAITAHHAAETLDAALINASALVIGPGLGASEGASALTLRAVQQQDVPVVVDADALNALARVPHLHKDFHAPTILTPHPGEYKRLADSLRITADPTSTDNRPRAAELLAQRLGCIVVLKGAHTVVTDGHQTWISPSGHHALATGGTGDVLSGVIAGLLAQHARIGPTRPTQTPPLSLYDVARIAVFAHGLAGERWAAKHNADAGLLATELASELPSSLGQLSTHHTP